MHLGCTKLTGSKGPPPPELQRTVGPFIFTSGATGRTPTPPHARPHPHPRPQKPRQEHPTPPPHAPVLLPWRNELLVDRGQTDLTRAFRFDLGLRLPIGPEPVHPHVVVVVVHGPYTAGHSGHLTKGVGGGVGAVGRRRRPTQSEWSNGWVGPIWASCGCVCARMCVRDPPQVIFRQVILCQVMVQQVILRQVVLCQVIQPQLFLPQVILPQVILPQVILPQVILMQFSAMFAMSAFLATLVTLWYPF